MSGIYGTKLMGRFIAVLTVILILLPGCARKQAVDDGITVHKYNSTLYKLGVSDPAVFNYLLSIGSDGLLLVDTGLPQNSAKIREKITTLSDRLIEKVIITHSHGDHIGGLDNLRDNAEIIANKITMTDTYYALPPKNRFDGAMRAIESKETIRFNGDDIELIVPPTGHYKDDLIVHFKTSKIWYMGDRVFPGNFPYIDIANGGNIDELLSSYKQLSTDYPDEIFISSHGDDMNAKELMAYGDTLLASMNVIRGELAKGKSVKDILAEKSLAAWDSFAQGFTNHEAWINTVADYDKKTSGLETIVKPLTETLEAKGRDEMVSLYHALRKTKKDEYRFDERDLNVFGYQLVNRNRLDDALAVFQLNIDSYPGSANVYDSYGETLLLMGDTAKAVTYYEKAVKVDSTFQNAKDVLKKLTGEN